MTYFPRALTILAAACILQATIVASDLLRTTTLISYKYGVLLATNFAPIQVADPIKIGRNILSTFEYKCNPTMGLTNASQSIGGDVFFVGNASSTLLSSLTQPSARSITTNVVTVSNTTVSLYVNVSQLGGYINISANNNPVASFFPIFSSFDISFNCSAPVPTQISTTNIVEYFLTNDFGNFGYTPSIVGPGGFIKTSKVQGVTLCCFASTCPVQSCCNPKTDPKCSNACKSIPCK